MILPIPVDLVVDEIDLQYDLEVQELNEPIDLTVENPINTTIFPGYLDVLTRLSNIEDKEPFWDIKYGEGYPPPYPVTSVDSRFGDITLGDLYDTDSLSFEDIASIFS